MRSEVLEMGKSRKQKSQIRRKYKFRDAVVSEKKMRPRLRVLRQKQLRGNHTAHGNNDKWGKK